MRTYHVYITGEEISLSIPRFPGKHGYRGLISEKFSIDHNMKVMDFSKLKYFQNKNNKTGEMVIEVEAPVSALAAF